MHRAVVLSVSLAVATLVVGQGEHHHAAPGEKVGTVHFATSCFAAAQKDFERALAMQHSFWYDESEGAFRAVAQREPSCAIASWGVAISLYHVLWDPPTTPASLKAGADAIQQARAAGARSARERDYIEALAEFYRDYEHRDQRPRAIAWSAAMERVHARYPDDDEATVFYALSLIGTQLLSDKTLANDRKAAELLEPIFRRQPDHPGAAHYLIHAYDSPTLAQYGVNAARRYATIAPSAPHALHMPSHIFTRLGLWDDSILSNIASSTSARRYGEQLHLNTAWDEELHADDYLIYAYLQTGQETKARAIYERARQLGGSEMTNKGQYGLFSIEARWAIERHAWADAAAIEPNPKANPVPQAISWWARAVGSACSGRADAASAAIDQLAAIRDALDQAHDTYWSKWRSNTWKRRPGPHTHVATVWHRSRC